MTSNVQRLMYLSNARRITSDNDSPRSNAFSIAASHKSSETRTFRNGVLGALGIGDHVVVEGNNLVSKFSKRFHLVSVNRFCFALIVTPVAKLFPIRDGLVEVAVLVTAGASGDRVETFTVRCADVDSCDPTTSHFNVSLDAALGNEFGKSIHAEAFAALVILDFKNVAIGEEPNGVRTVGGFAAGALTRLVPHFHCEVVGAGVATNVALDAFNSVPSHFSSPFMSTPSGCRYTLKPVPTPRQPYPPKNFPGVSLNRSRKEAA